MMIGSLPTEGPLYKKIQNYVFKFTDLIGQGNFSKVYKAHHQITNETVAIKIIELESLKSKKLEELLFSEIDVLKKLNHPNILQCFEVFTSNRNCYIITEFCNEGDLETRLKQEGPFNELKMEPYLRDIYQGLFYLAERSVIHRDLKIANVFMHNGKAKIADFGFAKFTKEKFKDVNIGSPIYMAPQGFIDNVYGPKTDVWAFGVLIYELLHGDTPFSFCKTENQLKYNLSIPLNRNRVKGQLSQQIKEVIFRCLQVDESKRMTVQELSTLPYFRRILNKQTMQNPTQTQFFQAPQIIMLSNQNSNLKIDNMMRQNHILLTPQDGNIQNRSQSPMPGYRRQFMEVGRNQNNSQSRKFGSVDKGKSTNIVNSVNLMKNTQNDKKNITKHSFNAYNIFVGKISFKECVNILHYCRLIFKFISVLKSSQYVDIGEITQLSKWLIQILEEMKKRIQKNEIIYQGENGPLRQQKLKQVRNEYDKKYKQQLQQYLKRVSFNQSNFTLSEIKVYLYNLFKKYDSIISREGGRANSVLLIIGHSIVMICDGTRVLKSCFDQQNYSYFLTYKDIETFLNTGKEEMTNNSYSNYRQKMIVYL